MEPLITLLVLAYPFIILYLNYKSLEIFFAALEKKYYKCWLGPKTDLPMMYIDDCIQQTVYNDLITIINRYNL